MLRLRGTELQLSDQGLWIGNFQLFEFEITQILDLKKPDRDFKAWGSKLYPQFPGTSGR